MPGHKMLHGKGNNAQSCGIENTEEYVAYEMKMVPEDDFRDCFTHLYNGSQKCVRESGIDFGEY